MFLVANSISLEFWKLKYLSICSKCIATKAPGFVSLFLTSILCWYWQSYAFYCHSESWWLCWCDVKPLEVVDPQPVFTIVSGMCVSCRVKGHSEYLLWFFFFLSGTGTAHLHSTNILPIALESQKHAASVFPAGDPLAPFRNPYCIPESKRHTALHCTALLWQHLQLSDCKTWKLHRAYGIFRKAEVLQD